MLNLQLKSLSKSNYVNKVYSIDPNDEKQFDNWIKGLDKLNESKPSPVVLYSWYFYIKIYSKKVICHKLKNCYKNGLI